MAETIKIKAKFNDKSIMRPLTGSKMISHTKNSTFVYFMNIIKTVYNDKGKNFTLNQYTLNKYESKTANNGIPGVFIKYDLAPIYVYYTIIKKSSIHFIVRIISIIGGVITVAGIIASFLHTSSHQLVRTFET